MLKCGARTMRRRVVLALVPLALTAPAFASYVGPSAGTELGGASWIPSELKQSAQNSVAMKSDVRGLSAVDDATARREAITALLQAVVSGDWADLLNKSGLSTIQSQQWIEALAANGLTTPPAGIPQRLWVAQMISTLMASNLNPWTLTNDDSGHTLPTDDSGKTNPAPDPVPQTPEPSAGFLLIGGAVGLLLKRRRA
jgi:hypothetical protein